LELQINEPPLLLVEAGHELAKLIRELGRLGWRRPRVDRLDSSRNSTRRIGSRKYFSADVSFLATMETDLLLHLGQGDGAQEGPELFTVGHLELAGLGSPQECPANGLDHIFRTETAPQRGWKKFVGNLVETRAIAVAKLTDRLPVAGTQAGDEPLFLILVFRHRPLRPRQLLVWFNSTYHSIFTEANQIRSGGKPTNLAATPDEWQLME
jgi:hypothetical protein